MQTQRFLFAGLGGIGQRHVRNLRALLGDGVEIGAYRVRKLPGVLTDGMEIEQGVTLEAQFGIRRFDDLEEALAWAADAVFVCNPTSQHLPIALRWRQKTGYPLFIEKPLSHSLAGVQELVALVESQRLVALVGYQLRFHPCLQRLQTLLRERAVGRVVAVRAEMGEYLPSWHPYEDYRQTYAAQRGLAVACCCHKSMIWITCMRCLAFPDAFSPWADI